MIETHLEAVDLNLLLALHVLLEERSVTRAAGRLGRTQPAVSRSLARLRALFGDPLLVREGATLRPTPRAESLGPALRQVLVDLETRVLRDRPFVPAEAVRTFVLATADYGDAMILPRLLPLLVREAPGIDLVVARADRPVTTLVEDADLAIGPRGGGGSVHSRLLLNDGFLVVVRDEHPRVGDTIDLETYVELPHVLVAPRGTPGGLVDDLLAARGLHRRVALRLPTFLAAPLAVETTDYLLTLPASFARRVVQGRPLRCVEPPIEIPPFALAASWHERWRHDPGHAWFRELVARSVGP